MAQMPDEDARRQLADMAGELYDRQLVTATGGNLSLRSPSRRDAFWITPSARFKGGLGPEDMVLVGLDGVRLDGELPPSVETAYHAGVMRVRPEIGALVHSHAPLATVFAMTGMEMLPVTTEAVLLMAYPTIEFHLGGTAGLHASVVERLGSTTAMGAFLRNHGLITMGETLRQAADATYMVEHTCRILIVARLLGVDPTLMPPEAVELFASQASAVV